MTGELLSSPITTPAQFQIEASGWTSLEIADPATLQFSIICRQTITQRPCVLNGPDSNGR